MADGISTWQEGIKIKQKYPTLSENLNVDVVIIGAGIVGITTAYLLSKTKLKVALIEAGIVGQDSATAFTTAFINQETDTEITTLVETFGKKSAKLSWEVGSEAIKFIESIVKKEKIECEFVRVDAITYAKDEKELSEIKEESDQASELGFATSIEKNDLGFDSAGYMKIAKQAKFHPLKYLSKLIEVANKNGVDIYENSEALTVDEKGDGLVVTTKKSTIFTKHVVMATYSPFTHPLSMYFKAGKYITYIIEAQIKKGLIREAIYEDWQNPYHYFRIDSKTKFDRIIIGGEDHREDIPVSEKKSLKALEKYLKEIVGDNYKIVRRWKGPILEPIDGLPYVGRFNKNSNIYLTHGFSGTGMTFGTTSAIIFNDLILGKKNKFVSLLDPQRLPTLKQLMAKGRDYSEELIGGALKNTLTQ